MGMVDFLSKLLNKDFVEKPYVTPVQKGNKSINVVSEPIPDIDYTLDAKQRKLFNLIENTQQNIFLQGQAGTGKSTLLQFLMKGKYGEAKEILLNGKIEKAGNFENIFAYASQAPVIFADTLWFNLTLGKDIPQEIVEQVCSKLQLTNVIKEKGFDYSLGDNADQLSGGQLARIELARAILSRRPVLLLDEINASLDKKTSDKIHQYLLNSDLTFVEVTHHYEANELGNYDNVIDLKGYME